MPPTWDAVPECHAALLISRLSLLIDSEPVYGRHCASFGSGVCHCVQWKEALGYLLTEGMNEDLCWWETLKRVLPLVGMWHEQKQEHIQIFRKSGVGRPGWEGDRSGRPGPTCLHSSPINSAPPSFQGLSRRMILSIIASFSSLAREPVPSPLCQTQGCALCISLFL